MVLLCVLNFYFFLSYEHCESRSCTTEEERGSRRLDLAPRGWKKDNFCSGSYVLKWQNSQKRSTLRAAPPPSATPGSPTRCCGIKMNSNRLMINFNKFLSTFYLCFVSFEISLLTFYHTSTVVPDLIQRRKGGGTVGLTWPHGGGKKIIFARAHMC